MRNKVFNFSIFEKENFLELQTDWRVAKFETKNRIRLRQICAKYGNRKWYLVYSFKGLPIPDIVGAVVKAAINFEEMQEYLGKKTKTKFE